MSISSNLSTGSLHIRILCVTFRISVNNAAKIRYYFIDNHGPHRKRLNAAGQHTTTLGRKRKKIKRNCTARVDGCFDLARKSTRRWISTPSGQIFLRSESRSVQAVRKPLRPGPWSESSDLRGPPLAEMTRGRHVRQGILHSRPKAQRLECCRSISQHWTTTIDIVAGSVTDWLAVESTITRTIQQATSTSLQDLNISLKRNRASSSPPSSPIIEKKQKTSVRLCNSTPSPSILAIKPDPTLLNLCAHSNFCGNNWTN